MKNLLFALALLTACSHEATQPTATSTSPAAPAKPAPPSVAEARDVLASAPDVDEYEFTNAAYSLPQDRTAMNEPALAAAKDLAKAGWISFDGSGKVVLSEKAKSDKRWLVRPNGFIDIVPLAKKELGQVTAVRPSADGADADFTWKWIPNELGAAFRSGPVHERFQGDQLATATLIWDGTKWSVLRITKRQP